MDENIFLSSLEDLTGKTAIVTGGTQGIGFHTTSYLAKLGAKVYVCALNTEKDLAGLSKTQASLSDYSSAHDCKGSIHFHNLNLSSIRSTKASAQELRRKIDDDSDGKIDILVCNAGIMFSPQIELSVDGYERTWAVNCLGHFVLVNSLLDMIESTAQAQGDARIIFTSSEGYKAAHKLGYDSLTTAIPGDGTSIFHLYRSFLRYCNSKLGILYLAFELDRRLEERGVEGVRVNACHPGRAPKTEIGDFQQTFMSPVANRWLKWAMTLGYRVGNSVEDCAKTQVSLAASKKARDGGIKGEYWVPKFDWWGRWRGCSREEVNTLGRNEGEARRMWEFCEEAVGKASNTE